MKPVIWVGSALDELKAFPDAARQSAGYQLNKVQFGELPDDWKPMRVIGAGACEIRLRDESGAYRVIYVARFIDAVYVLHAFQKKTQKTSLQDIDIARKRYRLIG